MDKKIFKNIFQKVIHKDECLVIGGIFMRASELKVFVAHVKNNIFAERIVKDDFKVYYQIIGCHSIDITLRRIGGKAFLVICDDEGLFDKNNQVSMADPTDKDNIIVGNVIITGLADRDGDLTSLTDEDIDLIERNICTALLTTSEGMKPVRIITMTV